MPFFSFDGVDGVGKSTQMQLFCDWLEQLGRTVVTCRDPGSTELGEQLRSLLLDHHGPPIGRRSEMLIYMAARAQLVDEIIRPALNRGAVVVSDRFVLANIVYQAHAGGLEPERVRAVGEVAIDGVRPDRVFLLDLPVDVAVSRRERAADRIEAQGTAYLEQVRAGFLQEAARDSTRIVVIDASGTREAIQAAVRAAAATVLGQF